MHSCSVTYILYHFLGIVDPCQQAGGGTAGIGIGIGVGAQGTGYCSVAKKIRSQNKPFKICEIKFLNYCF